MSRELFLKVKQIFKKYESHLSPFELCFASLSTSPTTRHVKFENLTKLCSLWWMILKHNFNEGGRYQPKGSWMIKHRNCWCFKSNDWKHFERRMFYSVVLIDIIPLFVTMSFCWKFVTWTEKSFIHHENLIQMYFIISLSLCANKSEVKFNFHSLPANRDVCNYSDE